MSPWFRAALVRAVKTVAQTAVALIGTGALGILDVDWVAIASASALAGIVSVLTSVAGLPETQTATTPAAGPDAVTVTADERSMLRDLRLVEGRDPATGAVPLDRTEP